MIALTLGVISHEVKTRAGGPGLAPRHLFVDCSRRRDGDGSGSRPWNNLRRANRVSLPAGSSLLLQRGSICHGFLSPRGSGRPGALIVIGAFGRGPLPRIETNGSSPDAVRIADESYIVVQNLDLTNRGDYLSPRRGVHVVADRAGTVRGVVIRRLYVHDVQGSDVKDLGGSGGIQVDHPTAGVFIADNLVENVNRSGIWVAGSGADPRPPAGAPWPSATTGVVIAHNTVLRMGGDGIVPTGTVGAVVADNVVCCGNLHGRPGIQYDAGIWTFNADGTVIDGNEVYGMRNGSSDGTGYDIDYDQDGTVVQSNYGYDNAGGFMLLCSSVGHRTAEVRFNLSVDEYVFDQAPCGVGPSPADTLTGVRVYNNTFVTATSLIRHDGVVAVHVLPQAGDVQFFNNIVYATRRQSSPFPCGRHCVANLFWRLPPSGARAIHADPRFVSGRAAGGSRLRAAAGFELRRASSAVGAGVRVAMDAAEDFFGNPIAMPPTIGFYQPRGGRRE